MGGNRESWTRREFLVLSAGATGGLLIAACSPAAETTTTAVAPSTTAATTPAVTTTTQPPVAISDYWDLLREGQRRIRTSPDHRAAQLSQMARAGDIAGLAEYVRDHIVVLPVNPSAWVSNNDGRRWGTRGVLRSGMGTPREIAQLIADMLNEAGTEASVVRGTIVKGSERPVLVPVAPAPFEVADAPDDLFTASGAERIQRERTADPALAAGMAAAARDAFDPASFDTLFTNDLSSVLPEVLIGDQILGLWHSEPGPYPADRGNSELGPVTATPEATFTLSIATDLDTRNPIAVATATYRLDQLAGRHVSAAFVPPAASLADLMTTRPADVTTVIPTLSVAGIDVTDDEQSQLTVAGDAFTIDGRVLVDDGDGFSSTTGRVSGAGDPAAAAEINVRRVIATHYPRLTVEVDVIDAAGETVADLGADQFLIVDDGYEAPFNLRRSRPTTPHIVFIVDNSSSVPEQWRDEGATRVVTEIATAVKAVHPEAMFRAAIVGPKGAGLLGWTNDPVQVGEHANNISLGSALWNSYVDAAVPEANAIVFMTDGVSAIDREATQDEPPPELLSQLTAGPPAIMLGSGELGAAFQGIADVTGGVALVIEDQDLGIAAVLEQLDKTLLPYDMLVLADETNSASDRTLRVSLPSAGIEAMAAYAVPDETTVGRVIAGLYLRVTANGVTVDRTLAGVPYRSGAEVTPHIAQEVRQSLFGKYSIITEAGAPSPSQVLDDSIAELLTWEPVWKATDGQEALEALAAAAELPHGRFTFAAPVSGRVGEPLTWETGLRMWLSTERTIPAGDVDILRRNVDFLPVSRFVTSTVEDSAESARITAERTSTLAAFEAAIYETTSAARLTGNLKEIGIGTVTPEERDAFDAISRGWPGSFRLAFNDPLDSAVAADPKSGGLIAVLGDGTGGGITEEEINRAFDQAVALAELGGRAGFQAWANLEKAKLEKLRFATLVIHRMSVEGILDLIEEEVCSRLEDAASGWATGAVSAAGEEMEGFVDAYSEAADAASSYGDALGLPPAIPTSLPVC